ncbi:transporter substrate-binding domain-containing protein [Marinomonas sp. C2222]|uniref:Transporter substrate-binding domain-containing protein n=1 Tax=Marinomonas sargassi TaxID=2984494 RepID=A0ABT2YUG6_9GAMM|nr:transporter substrate-binding domain-containing protein [Marinomonas sargassi]MCV2403536.1 transporter substrate-binding domain-containing protein [Marinomonas sargassi]
MKKITSAIVSTLSILTTGLLCQTAVASTTMTEGKMVVGMDITYPPFESYDGDKVIGFDPELAALLGEQIGATPEFSNNSFASLILGLKSNKFDVVMSGMYILPKRLKVVDAIPYARTGASIIVKKGSSIQPQSEKDLCGVKVGVQQGESYVGSLNELSETYCKPNGKPAVIVQEFPSAPEAVQAILSGNIQAQILIDAAAKLMVEKTKGRVEVSTPDLVYASTIGLFLSKENQALKKDLEKAMATITKNGSLPALLEKYELTPAFK